MTTMTREIETADAGEREPTPMPWPMPALTGVLRAAPEDFQVTEVLPFAPTGAGEHAFLRIRKRTLDSAEVARRLAACAGVPRRAVGMAGRKDRHAVAEQCFSVHLPGRPDPDWSAVESAGLTVLDVTRHVRKLRIGALTGNRFRIVLRALRGDRAAADAVLRRLVVGGVPNYFGPQRFGRGGGNRALADRLLVEGRAVRDRDERSLALSSARSLIFNAVLARRVQDGTWDRAIPGDVMMLDGCHSVFAADAADAQLAARLSAGDIHPTGPLWGCGETLVHGDCAALETHIAAGFSGLARGLEALGVRAARRALRVRPGTLVWDWEEDSLVLEFTLPAGAYATVLVAAVVAGPNTPQGFARAGALC